MTEYADVKTIVERFRLMGEQTPSLRAIRDALGGGSLETINHLRRRALTELGLEPTQEPEPELHGDRPTEDEAIVTDPRRAAIADNPELRARYKAELEEETALVLARSHLSQLIATSRALKPYLTVRDTIEAGGGMRQRQRAASVVGAFLDARARARRLPGTEYISPPHRRNPASAGRDGPMDRLERGELTIDACERVLACLIAEEETSSDGRPDHIPAA
jgi:hypothetical protein